MPVVLTARAPSREFYEKVNEVAGVAADPPAGLIVHTATEAEDGVHVVDVWESQAHIDEFVNTRLGPAFASVGGPDGPPSLELTEPFQVIRGT